MKASAGQKLARELAAKDRRAARDLAWSAKSHRAEAKALATGAKGKRARAARIRELCKRARVALRERQKERRAELAAELRATQAREREELGARCAKDREIVSLSVADRRAKARALRALAKGEAAQARALRERHASEKQRAAHRRGAEHFEEIDAFVRDGMERAGVHGALVAAWTGAPVTYKQKRISEALAALRKKYPKKRGRFFADEVAGFIIEKEIELPHGGDPTSAEDVPEEVIAPWYAEQEEAGARIFAEEQEREARWYEAAHERAVSAVRQVDELRELAGDPNVERGLADELRRAADRYMTIARRVDEAARLGEIEGREASRADLEAELARLESAAQEAGRAELRARMSRDEAPARRKTAASSRTVPMSAGGWDIDSPLAGASWRAQGSSATQRKAEQEAERRAEARKIAEAAVADMQAAREEVERAHGDAIDANAGASVEARTALQLYHDTYDAIARFQSATYPAVIGGRLSELEIAAGALRLRAEDLREAVRKLRARLNVEAAAKQRATSQRKRARKAPASPDVPF